MSQPARPTGRTLEEFKDQDTESGLKPAENALLACAHQGDPCILDKNEKPPVRASFIRFLALGGDDEAPVHEKGIWLFNATIEEQLDLNQCKGVLPLNLNDCSFSSHQPIILQDAHISLLSLQGSAVPGGINGDRATVRGNVFLRNGAQINGDVNFGGAHIHGDLDASGSSLHVSNQHALSLDGARIGGNLDMRGNRKISGEVRLTGVKIRGDLAAVGSTLHNDGGDALNCDGARIGGDVYLRERAKITGTVRLLGARIGGDLDAVGSTLTAEGYRALNAQHAVIDGNVILSRGFAAPGTIYFLGATIGRILDLRGSTIERPGGCAVDLRHVRVHGTLRLDSVRDEDEVPGRIDGDIDLRGAKVAYFVDRLAGPDRTPVSGAIHLDQFSYERFVEDSTLDVTARRRWLHFQPAHHLRADAKTNGNVNEPKGFRPQPYNQLAEVYGAMGHERDRHEVLRIKHKHALRDDVGVTLRMGWRERLKAWLWSGRSWRGLAPLKWLFIERPVGYGHRVKPMFYGLIGLFLFSFAVFWGASAEGYIVPQDTRMIAYDQMVESCDGPWTRCDLNILSDYPEFNSFVYAADVLLPVVGLEQQTAWTPKGWKLNALKWLDILYGWFTGLMLVAIVSGVVQRA